MSRVFVVQESRYKRPDGSTVTHDYSTLYPYGPVHFLLPPSRKQLEDENGDELELLKANLAEFNAVADYIVFSGDPVLCALAAIVVYSLTEGETIQVLKWNRKDATYDPVIITLP